MECGVSQCHTPIKRIANTMNKSIKCNSESEFKLLFEPGKIGNLILKNRLIVTAMVTNYCEHNNIPSERLIRYMEKKAQGGWGLIITEDYAISPQGKGSKNLMGLWSDDQIEPNAEFVKRVHEAGSCLCAQIYHAGRETTEAVIGEQPVAPSAVKEPTMRDIPRELSIPEIHDIIQDFANAAFRAKKAGFDMIEIHGAHGYLVNQFMSSFANKRCDEYGGSIKNRARFAIEVVKAIKDKVGYGYPVSFRLNTSDEVEGGITPKEAAVFAKMLENAGVDLINCSQGMYVSREAIIPPTAVPVANFVENAALIHKSVSIPVAVVGRINDPYLAESILATGKADFISMGRASLADPFFPNKAQRGAVEEIITCIACCQGCTGQSKFGNPIGCMLNPLTGRECEYDLSLALKSKKVAIIGGGIVGCEVAIAAALKGHQVTIYEKSKQLGGQWRIAGVPSGKENFSSFVAWQKSELQRLNVTVVFEWQNELQELLATHPDVIIVATGSLTSLPPIPGLRASSTVCDAREVLSGDIKIKGNIAVLGGGMVGSETADFLAGQGCNVSIIEMTSKIAQDAEISPRKLLLRSLKKRDVFIYTDTKVTKVGSDYVKAIRNGEDILIKDMDALVVALGAQSFNPFSEALQDFDGQVIVVGDAASVKNGLANIKEGFDVGLSL